MDTDSSQTAILELYDRLNWEHLGKMHRAGLVHLVSSSLSVSEDEVWFVVNKQYGPADDVSSDLLLNDEMTGTNNDGFDPSI